MTDRTKQEAERLCKGVKKNKDLCLAFTILQQYYRKIKQGFRARAYGKARQTLIDWEAEHNRKITIEDVFKPREGLEITEETIKGPMKSDGKRGNPKGKFLIKGIGKGVAWKVYQYITKGKIDEVELAEQDLLEKKKIAQGKIKPKTKKEKAILELSEISFIGKTKAKSLYEDEGIRSVQQLRGLSKKRLQKLLSKNQLLMLKYHEHIKERVPRAFTEMLEKALSYLLKKTYGKGYEVVFGGSYRRDHADSGDIDIVIKSEDSQGRKNKKFTLTSFVSLLKEWGVVFETLTSGSKTFKGIGRCPGMPDFIFRIDILYARPKEWIAALVAFTGNDRLNREMRFKAQEKGWKLSEKGLFERGTDERVVEGGLQSEEQLFDLLDMRYLEPHERG